MVPQRAVRIRLRIYFDGVVDLLGVDLSSSKGDSSVRWLGRGHIALAKSLHGTRGWMFGRELQRLTSRESWIFPNSKAIFANCDGPHSLQVRRVYSSPGECRLHIWAYFTPGWREWVAGSSVDGIAFLDVIPHAKQVSHTTDRLDTSQPASVGNCKTKYINSDLVSEVGF
jgi:hypothetical protein